MPLRLLTFSLLLVALFSFSRWPLLYDPLVYEEGVFADLMLHQPAGPNYLLYARLADTPLRGSAEHPALLYESLRLLGRWAAPWLAPLNDTALNFSLRSLFALVSLPIWLGLGWLAWQSGSRFALGLVLAGMLAPLSLLSSTQLQLDGSLGVLLTGGVALALLGTATGHLRHPLWLALAALLLGLGKQEWSLALLGAIGLAALWAKLRQESLWRGGIAALLLGLLVGNTLSFAFDPHNYLGGFRMMLRVGQTGMAVTGPGLGRWSSVLLERLPLLLSLLLLAGAAWLRPRPPTSIAPARILFGFSLLLFLGFFASSWGADGRYFAPALVVALATAIAWAPRHPPACAAGLLLLALMLHSTLFFATRSLTPCAYPQPQAPTLACVPRLATAQAWRPQAGDFVSDALEWSDAHWLASQHQHALCATHTPPPRCGWSHRVILP